MTASLQSGCSHSTAPTGSEKEAPMASLAKLSSVLILSLLLAACGTGAESKGELSESRLAEAEAPTDAIGSERLAEGKSEGMREDAVSDEGPSELDLGAGMHGRVEHPVAG